MSSSQAAIASLLRLASNGAGATAARSRVEEAARKWPWGHRQMPAVFRELRRLQEHLFFGNAILLVVANVEALEKIIDSLLPHDPSLEWLLLEWKALRSATCQKSYSLAQNRRKADREHRAAESKGQPSAAGSMNRPSVDAFTTPHDVLAHIILRDVLSGTRYQARDAKEPLLLRVPPRLVPKLMHDGFRGVFLAVSVFETMECVLKPDSPWPKGVHVLITTTTLSGQWTVVNWHMGGHKGLDKRFPWLQMTFDAGTMAHQEALVAASTGTNAMTGSVTICWPPILLAICVGVSFLHPHPTFMHISWCAEHAIWRDQGYTRFWPRWLREHFRPAWTRYAAWKRLSVRQRAALLKVGTEIRTFDDSSDNQEEWRNITLSVRRVQQSEQVGGVPTIFTVPRVTLRAARRSGQPEPAPDLQDEFDLAGRPFAVVTPSDEDVAGGDAGTATTPPPGGESRSGGDVGSGGGGVGSRKTTSQNQYLQEQLLNSLLRQLNAPMRTPPRLHPLRPSFLRLASNGAGATAARSRVEEAARKWPWGHRQMPAVFRELRRLQEHLFFGNAILLVVANVEALEKIIDSLLPHDPSLEWLLLEWKALRSATCQKSYSLAQNRRKADREHRAAESKGQPSAAGSMNRPSVDAFTTPHDVLAHIILRDVLSGTRYQARDAKEPLLLRVPPRLVPKLMHDGFRGVFLAVSVFETMECVLKPDSPWPKGVHVLITTTTLSGQWTVVNWHMGGHKGLDKRFPWLQMTFDAGTMAHQEALVAASTGTNAMTGSVTICWPPILLAICVGVSFLHPHPTFMHISWCAEHAIWRDQGYTRFWPRWLREHFRPAWTRYAAWKRLSVRQRAALLKVGTEIRTFDDSSDNQEEWRNITLSVRRVQQSEQVGGVPTIFTVPRVTLRAARRSGQPEPAPDLQDEFDLAGRPFAVVTPSDEDVAGGDAGTATTPPPGGESRSGGDVGSGGGGVGSGGDGETMALLAQFLPDTPLTQPAAGHAVDAPLPVLRGLRNLNNTCFFNATLQILLALLGEVPADEAGEADDAGESEDDDDMEGVKNDAAAAAADDDGMEGVTEDDDEDEDDDVGRVAVATAFARLRQAFFAATWDSRLCFGQELWRLHSTLASTLRKLAPNSSRVFTGYDQQDATEVCWH